MQDRYPTQPEAQEARIRYLESMRNYVMTPEDELRAAQQSVNVPLERQYTCSQLQNSYWATPRETSESAQAFVNDQHRKPSLISRFKTWLGGLTK